MYEDAKTAEAIPPAAEGSREYSGSRPPQVRAKQTGAGEEPAPGGRGAELRSDAGRNQWVMTSWPGESGNTCIDGSGQGSPKRLITSR